MFFFMGFYWQAPKWNSKPKMIWAFIKMGDPLKTRGFSTKRVWFWMRTGGTTTLGKPPFWCGKPNSNFYLHDLHFRWVVDPVFGRFFKLRLCTTVTTWINMWRAGQTRLGPGGSMKYQLTYIFLINVVAVVALKNTDWNDWNGMMIPNEEHILQVVQPPLNVPIVFPIPPETSRNSIPSISLFLDNFSFLGEDVMSIKNTLFWLFGCCFPAVVNFHFPIEEMLHILEKGRLADVTT